MLGDLAVFGFYVTLICSFLQLGLHNIALHLLPLQVAVVIVYVVIIAVGVCGNSVVVNVVVRHRRLHTSINGFIICLVVSDFVLCTFSLPVQLHYQLTNHWVSTFVRSGQTKQETRLSFFITPDGSTKTRKTQQ